MEEPRWWPNFEIAPIDYQDIIYYSAPKPKKKLNSLDEVDPELRRTFEKLGISLDEQKRLTGVAVDAVFDSVSVATTFKEKLAELGIIFCSFSEAVQRASRSWCRSTSARWCPTTTTTSPPSTRRSSATARSATSPRACAARWSCPPISASTPPDTGQFERTLIVAEEGAYVSYLEGCTAPMRDENQLHAAVVELVAVGDDVADQVFDGAELVSRRQGRQGRHLQLRHQARRLPRRELEDLLDAGRDRLGHHLEVSRACILQGDDSVGEFYSVALTNNNQQADTGTKMIHIGKNTKSTIVSKGISAGNGQNTYRGLVKILKGATRRAQLLAVRFAAAGRPLRRAHVPVHRGARTPTATVEHEASHVEDRRGPDLLLQAARPLGRGRRQHDRQRLLQGGVPRAADGVRGRGAEAAGGEFGGERGVSSA